MNKNNKLSLVLLGFIIGFFIATIFILVANYVPKYIMSWFSAIGTFLAVLVSLFLANRTEKINIEVRASLSIYKVKGSGEPYKFVYKIDGINRGKGSDVIDEVKLILVNNSMNNMCFTSHIPIIPNSYFEDSHEQKSFIDPAFSTITSKTLIVVKLSTYSGKEYTLEINPTIITTK